MSSRLPNLARLFIRTAVLLPLLGLTACKSELLNPSGDVALQQRDLLINSTLLMLLIIVPVIVLTVLFAWRYRASNQQARYEPDWHHSTQLELVIWSAPLLIIICLGALTWLGTHLLDPYRPLNRIAADKLVTAETRALQVNVVALDWKWLFIYPEYGIASVNELAVPVDRPVRMHITASNVMNSLYIPDFAGMVYAMPGMETRLNGVINRPGESKGFSANYSGAGFSGMRFVMHGLNEADFDRWISTVKQGSDNLTRDVYLQLARPSERDPVRYFAAMDAGLYKAILNRCVETNRMCMDEMMALDARGGVGMTGSTNLAPLQSGELQYRSAGGPAKSYVVGICRSDDAAAGDAEGLATRIVDQTPLLGAGMTPRWAQQSRVVQASLQ